MKVLVIGSTGRAGSRIVAEGLRRGHEVVGLSRNDDAGIKKDLWQLSTEDVKAFDVVVSAFGTWTDQSLHLKAAQHLDAIMKPLDTRWIAVGGAGSLYVAPNLRLMDSEGFPAEYKAVAEGMAQGLLYLEEAAESNWSYFSPSAAFEPGEKTENYQFGLDDLLFDENGKSYISMEDYAAALLDVIEKDLYNKKRFTASQM